MPNLTAELLAEIALRTPIAGLDRLLTVAKQRSPTWQSITLRIPDARAKAVTFSLDEGSGGRPDKRSQLTVNPKKAP